METAAEPQGLEALLSHFILLLVVVDPLAVAGVFPALIAGSSEAVRRSTAIKACLLSAGILVLFALGGNWVLMALGIGSPAFRIAGGLLLLVLAAEMVFAHHSGLRSMTSSEQQEAIRRQDIAVFPIAFPLISGPGAITSTMFFASQASGPWEHAAILAIIAAVIGLTYLSLRFASRLTDLLGETGTNVVGRLFGLLLAGLAVQFIVDGIKGCFPGIAL